jgi:hypothetical protein
LQLPLRNTSSTRHALRTRCLQHDHAGGAPPPPAPVVACNDSGDPIVGCYSPLFGYYTINGWDYVTPAPVGFVANVGIGFGGGSTTVINNTVVNRWIPLKKRAGVGALDLYSLRHTFASLGRTAGESGGSGSSDRNLSGVRAC